ncbi:glucosaminidase domain-containing protein [Lactococcus nasutitermitis]|uniref:Glucosaminidase domain-containing protein n=1 Tax=Lactococcus nasutitermitis TaxID=1652957 RepID=A0ABV9JF66_9LACT|nr:glucosaminidase domain-containing protein [Lactococcus nasutitermitis]
MSRYISKHEIKYYENQMNASMKNKKLYSSIALVLLLAQTGLPAFADVTTATTAPADTVTSDAIAESSQAATDNSSAASSNATSSSTETSSSASSQSSEASSASSAGNSSSSAMESSSSAPSSSSAAPSSSATNSNSSASSSSASSAVSSVTSSVASSGASSQAKSASVAPKQSVSTLAPSTARAIEGAASQYSSSTSLIPENGTAVNAVTVNSSTEAFIAQIGEQSRIIARNKGIYASVMIAQAILESGSGNSQLAAQDNNLFGVKGSYHGKSATFNTEEQTSTGRSYTISADFAAYPSTTEALIQYADLISSHYQDATKAKAGNYEDALKAIKAGGYATDTDYVSKVQNIIQAYGLTDYDYDTNYAQAQYQAVTPQSTSETTYATNANVKATGAGISGVQYNFVDDPTTKVTIKTFKSVNPALDTTVRLLGYATGKLNVATTYQDTAALISDSYVQALNIKLGANVADANGAVTNTKLVSKDASLIPGDIVYYTTADNQVAYGLYVGNGYVEQVTSVNSGTKAVLTALSGATVTAVRRVAPVVTKTKGAIQWESTIFKGNLVEPQNTVLLSKNLDGAYMSNNPYPDGQCTAYAWQYVYDNSNHRLALPNNLGNGQDWVASMIGYGYKADGKPHAGDIVSFAGGSFGSSPAYGHVAVVTAVNPDGTFNIAEGNYLGIWGHVRTNLTANSDTTFVTLTK